jgi:hypothetical protein
LRAAGSSAPHPKVLETDALSPDPCGGESQKVVVRACDRG